MEVGGKIMGVNVVGEMVEVGGKVMEVGEVEEEVPLEVPLEDASATGVSEGWNFVRKMVDPRLPTEVEVANHELTHLPCRNWCHACVKAKGKDLDHRGAVDKERKLSEYCFDYCFLGDELGIS